jgi:hypothetical protein
MISSEGAGIIINDDDNVLQTFNAGSSETDLSQMNCLWGTARDVSGNSPHGSIKFQIQEPECVYIVGLSDSGLPVNYGIGQRQTNIAQMRFRANNTFTIEERDSDGVLREIQTNTGNTFLPLQTIEIRADSLDDTETKYLRYLINGAEYTNFRTDADRIEMRPELKLMPNGRFNTTRLEEMVVSGGTFKLDNCLDVSSITTPGTGYLVNEHISLTTASAQVSTAVVSSVDASGGITGITFIDHEGGCSTAGESITAVGKVSGSSDGVIAFSPVQSNQIISAGTSYLPGSALASVIGGTTVDEIITISSVAPGTSGITDFTFDFPSNFGNDVVPGSIISISQAPNGVGCSVQVNSTDIRIPSLCKMEYDTIPRTGTDEPLALHKDATFEPSQGWLDLTGMQPKTQDPAEPMEVQGTKSVVKDRETDSMLVNVEEFKLSSICKDGGVQQAVAVLPYGTEQPQFQGGDVQKVDGTFYHQPYNLIYHKLENPQVENHNQLRVRMTDPVGNPISQLEHPTTLTFDVRPRPH